MLQVMRKHMHLQVQQTVVFWSDLKKLSRCLLKICKERMVHCSCRCTWLCTTVQEAEQWHVPMLLTQQGGCRRNERQTAITGGWIRFMYGPTGRHYLTWPIFTAHGQLLRNHMGVKITSAHIEQCPDHVPHLQRLCVSCIAFNSLGRAAVSIG